VSLVWTPMQSCLDAITCLRITRLAHLQAHRHQRRQARRRGHRRRRAFCISCDVSVLARRASVRLWPSGVDLCLLGGRGPRTHSLMVLSLGCHPFQTLHKSCLLGSCALRAPSAVLRSCGPYSGPAALIEARPAAPGPARPADRGVPTQRKNKWIIAKSHGCAPTEDRKQRIARARVRAFLYHRGVIAVNCWRRDRGGASAAALTALNCRAAGPRRWALAAPPGGASLRSDAATRINAAILYP